MTVNVCSPPFGERKGIKMKIDLKKLGLTSESTLEEIQTALEGVDASTLDEVKTLTDAAAAGARKAALSSAHKNSLSEEDMKEYKEYKQNKKMTALKSNEIIKKFSNEDQELIIKAEGLSDLEEDELNNRLKEVETKYAKRIKASLPPKIGEEDEEKDVESDLNIDPADL